MLGSGEREALVGLSGQVVGKVNSISGPWPLVDWPIATLSGHFALLPLSQG